MANELRFNESFYLSQNPDVAAAVSRGQFANAEAHYNQFGRFEGRDPNAYFDTSYYLSQYPDVANARSNPLEHFLTYGAAEGRFANAAEASAIDTNGNGFANEFDAATYLNSNADLKAAFGTDAVAALKHYQLFGQFESRPGVQLTNGTALTGPFTNTGTAPNAGSTFTLATAIDSLTGTNANDQFNAVIDGTNNTFQTGDSINGGTGTDTLRIVASSPTSTGAIASLRSVENINVSATADTALNLSDATGVENITLTGLASGTDLSVTGLANIVTLGATNTSTTAGSTPDASSVTAAYAASAVSGKADVQNIVLNNATATAFSVNGIESFAVNAASGTNTVSLASTGGATVNTVSVTGAGDLTITNTLANTVTTFDASKATGDVVATFDDGGNVTATGGAGDDVFTFEGTGVGSASTGLTTKDVVNGGAGFDTIVVDAGNYSAPAAATPFNGLTSIERVTFESSTDGATVNGATFTNAGITNINFNTAGDDVINNAGSARTYEFGATLNNGDATFNLNASSTTVNLALLGTAAGDNAIVDAVAINLNASQPATAVATINLSSQGTLADGTFNGVGTVTAAAGSTVNITGSGNLDLNGFANRVIVDASAHTGSLVVEGSKFVAFSSGSTPAAFVSGADTITLGSGEDTVQFADALASGVINTTTTATTAQGIQFDTINSFTAGASGDILDFGAATGATTPVGYTALTSAVQTNVDNNATTLIEAADIAVANTTAATGSSTVGAGTWTAFSFNGETYAVYDAAQPSSGTETYVSGTDLLVKLAGVDVSALTADNFA